MSLLIIARLTLGSSNLLRSYRSPRMRMPDLPVSRNLQNFWEASKLLHGQTLERFLAIQCSWFNDDKPHHHHPCNNKPLGWVERSDGTTSLLTPVQARRYYCKFYEELARKTGTWKRILTLREEGANIQILSYNDIECDYLDK